MASETEVPSELSSLFERVLRHRDFSLFLSFLLGFTNTTTSQSDSQNPSQNPDQGSPQTTRAAPNERIILVNPFTQGMVVIEGAASLESLLRELATKNGDPPASKASIEAMPVVEIGEGDDKYGECSICLEEWEVGGVAKEMPCKHRFHTNCIEKWLGIHGSCPVCRYKMPVDEGEWSKKGDQNHGRRERREIWVSFSFNGSRNNGDSNQSPPSGPNDVSSSNPRPDHEMED